MPPPHWAHLCPSAVTDATQPLGLVLESTRDQSASLLRGELAISFIAVRVRRSGSTRVQEEKVGSRTGEHRHSH